MAFKVKHWIFEGDSEIVNNSLRKGDMPGLAFNHLVRDTVQSFSFSHIYIYRQGNTLTKSAGLFFPLLVWIEVVPQNIVDFFS